jgi:solute carrier family 35 (adenosine 3'-phospho 5'-phosphosulfate transporter), member B3
MEMPAKSDDNLVDLDMQASSTKYERYVRFWFLVAGLMFFFGCHNYLQEFIMRLPGFRIGVFLGYLEVLGVAVCSHFERQYVGEAVRRAPWSSYWMLCAMLLISSATSNIALGYINYPTKVVFRSCKLIPTMIIAVMYNKKKVHAFEFFFGSLISAGMVLFAAADFQVYPNFDFVGKLIHCHYTYPPIPPQIARLSL